MKKYNIIIMAGGENELWCQKYGYKKRAFLPLLGKPMLGWVIDAFHRSEYIDKIIVVGAEELKGLTSMRYVYKHLYGGNSFMRNLFTAIFYLKAVIYKFSNTHSGYLISFCDAAFLTTSSIDACLKNITEHDPGIGLHYVLKETLANAGYPTENRSYMRVGGKDYTGSVIYYVKKTRKLLRLFKDIILIRKYRKEPNKIFENIAPEVSSVSGIERALSKRLATKVKIFISPYAEIGVDVDKTSDYELAKIQLQKAQEEYVKREF